MALRQVEALCEDWRPKGRVAIQKNSLDHHVVFDSRYKEGLKYMGSNPNLWFIREC